MMSIRKLRLMNESERMEWYENANGKDLAIVLKNEGIKCVYKMKKAEKLAMVIDLVENITDEEIEIIYNDTKRLNEEINVRQSFKEEFESTLYARWAAKEITLEEFKQTIINYNVSIPINVADKEYAIDLFHRKYNINSMYEHYVCGIDAYYYSVLDAEFEWCNVFRNSYECRNYNLNGQQLYKLNTVDDNGYLQLAFTFNDFGRYILCVYKNYELLGYYRDGDIDNIKKLVAYDDKLSDEDLHTYTELLELLEKQHEKYNKILKMDMTLQKKLKRPERYKKFITDKIN